MRRRSGFSFGLQPSQIRWRLFAVCSGVGIALAHVWLTAIPLNDEFAARSLPAWAIPFFLRASFGTGAFGYYLYVCFQIAFRGNQPDLPSESQHAWSAIPASRPTRRISPFEHPWAMTVVLYVTVVAISLFLVLYAAVACQAQHGHFGTLTEAAAFVRLAIVTVLQPSIILGAVMSGLMLLSTVLRARAAN